jgi:hypothetical protein
MDSRRFRTKLGFIPNSFRDNLLGCASDPELLDKGTFAHDIYLRVLCEISQNGMDKNV